ncbi:hypothetical protein D3C75_1039020 [compost metagenome]
MDLFCCSSIPSPEKAYMSRGTGPTVLPPDRLSLPKFPDPTAIIITRNRQSLGNSCFCYSGLI